MIVNNNMLQLYHKTICFLNTYIIIVRVVHEQFKVNYMIIPSLNSV